MITRFDILKFLEDTFLSIQNKINSIKPGSVLRSIFYSVSLALEEVFNAIEEVKKNSYIHTASGEYLDQLIYGLSKLERIQGRRAFGYVSLRPISFTFDSLQAIDTLSNIVFSKYDIKTNSLYIPSLAVRFAVSSASGINNYLLLPPLVFSLRYQDDFYYEINPNTGKQRIAEIFSDAVKSEFLKNPNKKISYIFLPAISEEFGQDKNLLSSAIDYVLQVGQQKFSLSNNFEYNLNNDETFVDFDAVAKLEDTIVVLGEASEFQGGSYSETDEEYRTRYWNFLKSLSKGTLPAIEEHLSNILTNAKVKLSSSTTPGIIDVYIYSDNQPISPALLLLSQEAIDEVKPAGTVVNIRFPKITYINILIDKKDTVSKSDVENLRIKFRDELSRLGIGDSFSYKDIWAFLNEQGGNFSNPYFGLSLTQEIFSLYKDTLKIFVCNNYYSHDNPDYLPDFCLSSSEFSYGDYVNIVNEGKLALYIFDKVRNYKSYITNNTYSSSLNLQAPRYPLRRIISRILNGEEILEENLRNFIKVKCKNLSIDICLREVSRDNYLNSLSQQKFAITVSDLDEVSANYYKIKFMTLPIKSDNDIELCDSKVGNDSYCFNNYYEFKILYFLSNDIQYIEYKDMEELSSSNSIIRLKPSFEINKNFVSKQNVALREE